MFTILKKGQQNEKDRKEIVLTLLSRITIEKQ